MLGSNTPGLNPSQRAAVEHEQGPLLVLAGAGSGKTRVITHRIARLLERGTRPEAILAVSFTNKAAAEMAERMAKLVGKTKAEKLWLSTFHSFGVRFLSEEMGRGETKGKFVIFDQGDSLGVVRELLRRVRAGERRLDPQAVLSRISLWKNRFETPETLSVGDFEYDAAAAEIYPEYIARLRSMHAVDFDDLVVRPVEIMRDQPAVRERWRNRFRHLLIDEFQDTNRSQLELVRLLANELSNVCVVGDDDQSIYGWRGADVGNILDFERHFVGATVVKLEENYRSRPAILGVANHVIAQGTQARHRKTLRATKSGGDRVRLSVLDAAIDEAKFVTREIRDLAKEGIRYDQMAVLYRSNLQARILEEELRIDGTPYRLFGGTVFFDRKEVKDAAAYLRVVLNPFDEISARRIVNYPARGIGDTSIERIAEFANERNLAFATALGKAAEIPNLPAAAVRGAESLHGMLERTRAKFRTGRGFAEAASELFGAAGIERDLLDSGPSNTAQRRVDNLKFLVESLRRYETNERADKPSLAAFLQQITLKNEQEEKEATNRVTLSSLHASKGLEFDYVFLIGCVEGQLPHLRTLDPKVTEASPTDVEEERRLFYVGVTRARERLYLTRIRQKTQRGKTEAATPSRFLEQLPEALTEDYTRPDREVLDSVDAASSARAILEQLAGRVPSAS
ncbi:MAG: UvrD-helicase domain-containing protein [Polyangiales bacterium]